jgi:putative glycosyltransferase (TIGR04348 family)
MSSRDALRLSIVTPYLAAANNGNWRTAARWAHLLSSHCRVIVQSADAFSPARADALIALHARRSRAAIAAWRAQRGVAPLVVTLTGTDLYRDLPAGDAATQASLRDADRLIVLQADALDSLPPGARDRADVVHQSARTLAPWTRKSAQRLHCIFVAHLRPEKDPATVLEAWRHLPREADVTLTIVGEALDPALGEAARTLAARDGRVRWLGPRPHGWTRQAIKRAHVLICASRMEGGANVVVEAVTAGTPVVASRMSGNVGMLGVDYAGYFEVGDAQALATLLLRAWQAPQLRASLQAQCALRAPLFTPDAERAGLLAVLAGAGVPLRPSRTGRRPHATAVA